MKLRTITLATALALAVFAPATAVFAQTADKLPLQPLADKPGGSLCPVPNTRCITCPRR